MENRATKKPQMLQYLRNLQKLQVKNSGLLNINISSRSSKEFGISFDITIITERKNDSDDNVFSFYFYQFFDKEKNDSTYEQACDLILHFGGKI